MCSNVGVLSTVGIQYCGGYHEYRGGYLEYRGGVQYRGDIMINVGYLEYHGGVQCHRDIMSIVGVILSTVGLFSIVGDIMMHVGGYYEYRGVFSTVEENCFVI